MPADALRGPGSFLWLKPQVLQRTGRCQGLGGAFSCSGICSASAVPVSGDLPRPHGFLLFATALGVLLCASKCPGCWGWRSKQTECPGRVGGLVGQAQGLVEQRLFWGWGSVLIWEGTLWVWEELPHEDLGHAPAPGLRLASKCSAHAAGHDCPRTFAHTCPPPAALPSPGQRFLREGQSCASFLGGVGDLT